MSNICKTVSLRTRKIKDGRMLSYYLDYYPGYRDRKIKENPNGFLERIETIPTDKEHISQDEVIRLVLIIFRKQYYPDSHLCSAM